MPDAPARELVHVHDVCAPPNIARSRFMATALNRPHLRTTAWATDRAGIPDLAGVALRHRSGSNDEVLVERDGLAALIDLGDGRAALSVSGQDAADVDRFVVEVRDLLPRTAPDPEAPEVPVTFWSYHPAGVRSRRRRITVPPWADCMGNYPEATFRALKPLMDGFKPGAAGQLLLWHGEPGTGKTYALRALAWEWRDWCDLHYITDPEVLFGDNASYMLDVLLEDDGPEMLEARAVGDIALDEPEPKIDERAADGRWRLLVLEDTGEMMSADARERTGQGLGRLLNVVDGLIGQGLRILVLVTTNERIGRLHPAVARAGRCASSIPFHALPYAEAVEWLAERGVGGPGETALPDDWEHEPPKVVTAADLFAIVAGAETSSDREPAPVGFTS